MQAALGRTGLYEGIDYCGVEVLSDIRIIPDTKWIMVSKIDKNEIYTDLYLESGIISGITILLIIICGVGIAFLYNSRQKNIFRELYNKEKELWQQQEKFKVTMDSLGEGVITVDINGKLQYMNKLAEELTGWRFSDARGRRLEEIYSVKNEETGQKENNILEKVFKHGIVKELANHTILISKSGKEIPVMDTGAPIYDNDGSIIGIVIAFQDETEKRRRQKLIRESELRLRSTLDSMIEGCQLIGFDYKYLFLNKAALEQAKLPKEKLLGKTMMECYPGIENTKMFSVLKHCMEERIPDSLEYEFTYTDGSKKWFYLHFEPVHEGIFILSEDITDRKLAEEKQNELLNLITRVAEQVPGVIYQYCLKPDGTSCFPYASNGIINIYGVTPEEIRVDASPVFKVIHPDDLERVSKTIKESAKNLTLWHDEYRVKLPSGKTIWVEGNATPQKLEDGRILWHGYIYDITERKLDEEKIKKANRVYSVLSKINETIVRIKDKQRLFDEACRIAVEEGKFKMAWIGIVDESLNEVIPVASAGFEDDYLKSIKIDLNDEKFSQGPTGRAIKSGTHFIANNIAKDLEMIPWREKALQLGYKSSAALPIKVFGNTIGTYNLYSSEQFFFDEAEIKLLDELAMDISFAIESIENERKRKIYEEKIHKNEKFLSSLFDTVGDAIFVISMPDRKIENINKAAIHIFGYSPEEIIGKTMREFYKSEEAFLDYGKKLEEAIINNFKSVNEELNLIRKNGNSIWCDVQTTFLKENGNVKHAISVLHDITERKKLLEELMAAKDKAEEMNRVKNYFLSNMSHELRTPLISVLGFAELLQQELTNPEHVEFVNHIIEGGKRLNNTLTSILELTKLEAADSFISLKPYNIAEEIETRVKSFLPIANSKHLFLKTKINERNIRANIDSELFGKALYNLVNNAVKFTKEGGVFVTLNYEEKENCSWAVIKVIDTGIGIPKENLDKIFSAFRQSSEGDSRTHEGVGLGLTITKRIIEIMKGRIEVESEVGKGSTFTIRIPAIPETSQIKEQILGKTRITKTQTPSLKEREFKKVLIVEDNASNRLFIKRCLSGLFRIIDAEDGVTGISIASQEQVDLILMDINLGRGLDGIQTMHEIRKIPGYIRVPIVAVTAYAMFADRDRFLREGFDEYLAKPFKKDELLNLVKTCLEN